jgi:hypothetical protein
MNIHKVFFYTALTAATAFSLKNKKVFNIDKPSPILYYSKR